MLKVITKTTLISSVIYFSFFVFTNLTFALGNDGASGERKQAREDARIEREATAEAKNDAREEKKMERETVMVQKRTERCEQIVSKVTARISQMEGNKGVHIANYNKLGSRLEEMITSLNTIDADTTELEGDLVTLEEMISDYATTYSTFIDALSGDAVTDCSDLENGKRVSLNAAKGHLKGLIGKRQAIRAFYSSDVREDIQDLREKLVEAKKVAGEGDLDE